MEIIRVTEENLEKEHICCAISNDCDCQVVAKKEWLRERFADGLVFLKGNVRGKCFIEYIPAEKAWAPINADGYDYIDCLWVSGQFKGQGNSTLLLNECIRDAKERKRKGLVILSSEKKLPFLADSKFLRHNGFLLADSAAPYFQLYYLPFSEDAAAPSFRDCVKHPDVIDIGLILCYSHQCPFTAKYVPMLFDVAKEKEAILAYKRFTTAEDAQNAPTPYTAFSLFYEGKFLTHEIPSPKKFADIIDKL